MRSLVFAVVIYGGNGLFAGNYYDPVEETKIADFIERKILTGTYVTGNDHFVGCASDGKVIVTGIETNLDPIAFEQLCAGAKVSQR
jgi:hypothetical protein